MLSRLLIVSLLMLAAIAPVALAGTPEQLNDQAIVLEREGHYADAVSTYDTAAAQSSDNAIRVNLWRARVRGVLHDYGPRAQTLVLLMAALWIAHKLVTTVRRVRGWWTQFALYRRVRASTVTASIVNVKNEVEPDNTAYPDARTLRIALSVKNAGVKDHPLCFAANLLSPDDKCIHTVRQFVDVRLPPPLTRIDFDFENLHELTAQSDGGGWRVEVVLENNLKKLANVPIRVITQEMMLDDLTLDDVRLLVYDGNEHVVSNVVPTTAESIIPTARLRPAHLRAEKFSDLALRFELIRLDTEHLERSQDVSLHFNPSGVAEFCELSHPVAQHAMGEEMGDWQFKLYVAGRWLASIDFVVRSPETIVGDVRVEKFDIAASDDDGELSLVGSVAYLAEATSLLPVAHVKTPYPTALPLYDVVFGVMAGDEVLGHVQERVALKDDSNVLTGGQLDLAECNEVRGPVTFFLMVNGKCVASREVQLKHSRLRHADIEGRLTMASMKSKVDRDEADELLNSAHVV